MTDDQLSREHVEVLVRPTPNTVVARAAVEVLMQPTPTERIARTHVEVLVKQALTLSGTWSMT